MGSDRKATEDANTVGRCRWCGRRIGFAEDTTGKIWWDVVTGNRICMDKRGANYLFDEIGLHRKHELSVPRDMSREGVEKWLST